jgi:hypothetical protein
MAVYGYARVSTDGFLPESDSIPSGRDGSLIPFQLPFSPMFFFARRFTPEERLSCRYRLRPAFKPNRLHPALRAIQASALRRSSFSADED